MPIYEYQRPDGSTFEVFQAFHEQPLTQDPDTGVVVRRVLHAPAVHFKGSGFYNTDYGTRKRQREGSSHDDGAPAEGTAKKDAGSSSAAGSNGASSDSKPPAKPASGGKPDKSEPVAAG